METLSFVLFSLAGLIQLFAVITFCYKAFQVSFLWMLAVIFIPFAPLIFLIKYFEDVKAPFFWTIIGAWPLFALGMMTSPTFIDGFKEAFEQAIRESR